MRSVLSCASALSLLSLTAPVAAFWRMSCPGRLVDERADPIVAPGAVSGHVHTIAGGNGFNFSMDYADTQASQCSSCPIKHDLSNYWTPKLYYQAEDGTFEMVPQAGDGDGVLGGMTVYYLQRGGPNNDNLTAYPEGFRMTAGDPFKRSWGGDFASEAVSFVCLDYSGVSSQTNNLPNKTCPDGLRAQVFFPSCWDGENLDSSDHQSHMAYPTEYSYDNGPCPSSHPVHMISVFFEIIYSTVGYDWWNGTNQPFVFAQGDPTGYGFHGDFLNGWDVELLQNATNTCTNMSGLITDCPLFDFYTTEESQACVLSPQVDEEIDGPLAALPGCNPIQYGPGEASALGEADCAAGNFTSSTTYSTDVSSLGWSYVGCGADSTGNRTFQGTYYFDNNMTVPSCVSYCNNKGFTYAGLEYTTQCFCSNTLASDRAPTPGVLGNCFATCGGNSTQYCGGSNRLSIYNMTSSSVASAAAAKASAASNTVKVSCPASNNTIYTNTNGTQFMVECGIDRSGGDMGMTYVSAGNLQQCLDACSSTTGCLDVSLSGAACYMKSQIHNAQANGGVNGGRMIIASSSASASASKTASGSITGSASATGSASSTSGSGSASSSNLSGSASSGSASTTTTSSSATSSSAVATGLSCPSSNNTLYATPDGSEYLIECGIDHNGGDLAMKYVNNFQGCIMACMSTSSCVDVSLSGTACYMKSSVGAAVNNGVWGARLMTGSSKMKRDTAQWALM